MKVNIDRHTLEISKLLSRIRRLEEGITDALKELNMTSHPNLPIWYPAVFEQLQKLLEESK